MFVGLIIFGSLLLLLWPRLTSQSLNETKTVPSQSISITPPIDTVSGTATALLIPVATTTPETAIPITTGVPFIDETILKKQLGETVDFFLRDLMIFTDPKNPNRSFEIEALEFTDSRCPKSAVCVWAGERGLKLKITDKQSGASEEIYLGTRRAQIVKIMGLKITLFEIEDGKGGAYAKVKVE